VNLTKKHNAYLVNHLCYFREFFLLLLLLLLLFCSYINVMLWTSIFFWSDVPAAQLKLIFFTGILSLTFLLVLSVFRRAEI